MKIFELSSFPIEQEPDILALERRLAQWFSTHEFPVRLIAHSTSFPMHEPIRRIQEQYGALESLLGQIKPLTQVIDQQLAGEQPCGVLDVESTVLTQARDLFPTMQSYLHRRPQPREHLQALDDAIEQLFWPIPWAKEAMRMYEHMSREQLRAAQYLCITWEGANVSSEALRLTLRSAFKRPVRELDHLPGVLPGSYREHLSYLEPDDPIHPYMAVLLSFDMQGEWDAAVFHELIALNMDVSVAIDITTMGRSKATRVAEFAYNAAKVVAKDSKLVDTRGERVVNDAYEVLHELRLQTLHAIQVAILIKARTKQELEDRTATVRDLFGARLRLFRPPGAQGIALKLFSTMNRNRLEAPWRPRTQLSHVVGCAAGIVGFHRPNDTKGIYVGIDRIRRFPVFINLFEGNQAAHMIIAGQSGYGKTVLLNLLAERAVTVGGMQVIGIDAFHNGLRVERALAGCVCFRIGLEHTINILDVVYSDDAEGGWLNNQILHVVGQLAMLLGEPGKNNSGQECYLPRPLSSSERGVLALAIKRLYQHFGTNPDTPVGDMPTLHDLVTILDVMDDPLAESFANALRYLIYGSQTDLSDTTPEGQAFAGHTTVDWTFDNPVVYYDFKNVPTILRPFYYLQAMGAIWRYVRTRKITQDIFLEIDEYGFASQTEAVAVMGWVIAKTARKYRLGMVLVDQTMKPFFDTESGRQLHANAAAHFFFHMKTIEAMDVGRAMSELTEADVEWLCDAEPGQCLAVVRKDVYQVNVETHPLEARSFLNS